MKIHHMLPQHSLVPYKFILYSFFPYRICQTLALDCLFYQKVDVTAAVDVDGG